MMSDVRQFSSIRKQLNFYGKFIPLKRNAIVSMIVFGLLFLYIKENFYIDHSNFKPYLKLFLWLIGIFAVLILGFGLFYTLGCWLYFIIKNRRDNEKNATLQIGLDDGRKGTAGWVPARIFFSHVLMPLMGYVKVQMVYADLEMSPPVILNSFAEGWKDVTKKTGSRTLWLSERKVYQIKGFVLTFEDYLHFFSLPVFTRLTKSFYLTSPEIEMDAMEIPPSKTREMTEKVKTLKKVAGDFFNYKDFESGDDVRRIVWKIFARNRELVVRIPEVINPYASHIHLYCSFYNELSKDLEARYTSGMLSFYKDMLFNLCQTLEKNERKVELNIDQPVVDLMEVESKDRIGYILSSADWHKQMPITDIKLPKGDVALCISSMVSAEMLEDFIARNSTNVYIFKVSNYLDDEKFFHWQNLFLRNTSQSEHNKFLWYLSSFRRKVRSNEKKLEAIAEAENFNGVIL